MIQARAQLLFLRLAPRKVRLVANLIKGMEVARAAVVLEHLPKRAAEPVAKLLQSALANLRAQQGGDSRSEIYIKDVRVDGGPVLKRSRPRAFGRSALIRKRTSHVRMILIATGEGTKKDSSSSSYEVATREVSGDEALKSDAGITSRKGAPSSRETKGSARRPGVIRRIFNRKAI